MGCNMPKRQEKGRRALILEVLRKRCWALTRHTYPGFAPCTPCSERWGIDLVIPQTPLGSILMFFTDKETEAQRGQ